MREGGRGSESHADESSHIRLSPRRSLFGGSARATSRAGCAGGAQARALHDDLVGAMGKAVEGAVGEDGIVEQGHPLIDGAIACDGRGGPPVPLHQHIVEIAGLLRREFA